MRQRPVILLQGGRQTGKSTLARSLVEESDGARYVTLDDATALASVQNDPDGFLAGYSSKGLLVIDEVQRAPELFRAIKLSVDRDRRPGRFLLTGSANVLLLPKVSDSLAGRMDLLTLWPLSQGEIQETSERFLETVFSNKLPMHVDKSRRETTLYERTVRGGYPEVFSHDRSWRASWFESYLTAILQRDIRDLANIERLTELPRLLSLLASRMGSLVNSADISRSLALPNTTLKRYLSLLEATFLIHTLPPWFSRTGQRLVKSPKLFLADTGLASHLLRMDSDRWTHDPTATGPLVESLVIQELLKQATWSGERIHLFHFRTASGGEVDVVLENGSGEIVGIEVKAGATVHAADLKGLSALQQSAKRRFKRGIVLYSGDRVVPFAENIHAVPLSALWEWAHD